MTQTIAVITTTRADFGLLYCPIKGLFEDPHYQVKLIVTGSHLLPGEELQNKSLPSGLQVFRRVEIFSGSRDDQSVINGFSIATKSLAEAIQAAEPDFVMLLGDRFETLAAAIAATLTKVPIIHLCGGDVSEGSMDNAIRHAISKLAHIHFPSNDAAKKRLLQMGEDPRHVFMVGSPGLDQIAQCKHIEPGVILNELSINKVELPYFLITFHPTTLNKDLGRFELTELLCALSTYHAKKTCNYIFTGVNFDLGSECVYKAIIDFCKKSNHAYYFSNLGSEYYTNLMRGCEAVLGNSSSGFYEAPFLKKITINVGQRQAGRLAANSIINVKTQAEIVYALENLSKLTPPSFECPYGDGESTKQIKAALHSLRNKKNILIKRFKEII